MFCANLGAIVSSASAPIPVIGAAYGGGFFAGQISTAGNGIADYNLVIGPAATAQAYGLAWKTTTTNTAGTASLVDGLANTNAMNNASHPAAQFCRGLTIGGFTDWYMPAVNELEICYFNLKPQVTAVDPNDPAYGINNNAVPARPTTYTTSNPPQTTAGAFFAGGPQAFDNTITGYYWASTQGGDPALGRLQWFKSGIQSSGLKTSTTFSVRAIRKVPV